MSRFFDRIAKLTALMESEPSVAVFREQVLPLLLEDSSERFFFSEVKDPKWLEVFRECGVFAEIPAPHTTGKDASLRNPVWYPAWALRNLAGEAPVLVMEILVGLPDTHNQNVHVCLLDAAGTALAGAPELVYEWAITESEWMRGAERLDPLVVDAGTRFVQSLAPQSCASALGLARSMFSLRQAVSDELSLSERLRMSEWQFEEAASRLQEPLTRCSGLEYLKLVLEALEELAGAKEPWYLDHKLMIWRPAIEEDAQNSPNSLLSALVAVMRDSALQAVRDGNPSVISFLTESEFATLHRIALYLGRVEWDSLGSEISEFVTRSALLNDATAWHERYMLLEECFASFPEEAAKDYLEYIANLHDPSEQYTNLWPVRDVLSKDWLLRFQELKETQPPLEHPAFLMFHMTEAAGPIARQSDEDMANLGISEVVDRILSAQPAEKSSDSWLSDRTRDFERLAEQRPKDITSSAMQLRHLKPQYMRAVLRGITKAIGENVEGGVEWAPLLELCGWILDQEDEKPVVAEEEFGSYGRWDEAHLEVARLLEKGLQSSSAMIPDESLGSTWPFLTKLLASPDPTHSEEERRLGQEEPSTIAINTIRGTATEILLHYAFSRRRARGDSTPYPPLGEYAPEISAELDRHLDPAVEGSLAVHSIYGKWFPQLYGLDKDWALARRGSIFPPEDLPRLETAWNAYLAFSRVYTDIYHALESVYAAAIERVGAHSGDIKSLVDPDERLGGHLVLLYRHGELDLEGGHLEAFFATASDEVRFSVLTDAVGGLSNLEETDRKDACGSLSKLWDWRVGHPEHPAESGELSAFCWWFVQDGFDNAWAVGRMAASLWAGAELKLDGHVLKKLLTLAPAHTEDVLKCLGAITTNQRNRWWGIYEDEIARILRAGLNSSDKQVQEKAEDLVHSIGAQGFFSLGDLLPA